MQVTLLGRVKDSMRSIGASAWELRIAISLVLAAFGGWLAAVWFQAPEKQLESLAEGVRHIGRYGWTLAQANDLSKAESDFTARLPRESPTSDYMLISTNRASCITFCSLEWEITAITAGLSDYSLKDRFRLNVSVSVEPYPADARPGIGPPRYMWRETEWHWYAHLSRGGASHQGEELEAFLSRGDAPRQDEDWEAYLSRDDASRKGVGWEGNFSTNRPEVVLASFPEANRLLNIMGTRMHGVLERENDERNISPFKHWQP